MGLAERSKGLCFMGAEGRFCFFCSVLVTRYPIEGVAKECFLEALKYLTSKAPGWRVYCERLYHIDSHCE